MEVTTVPLALQPIAILFAALVAKYLYLATSSTRSTFFAFYCQQLANKVNNPENSSHQQVIAGGLALLVTLVPIVIILWLFESFVDVTFIWHFILLFIALGNVRINHVIKQVTKHVNQNANYQAKETLTPLVLRDTSNLSALGIVKAAIEMQLLRTFQLYAVVFWYLTFGPLAALSYRIVLEMHYCWNRKLRRFNYFGRCAEVVTYLGSWLPLRLSFLVYYFSHLSSHSVVHWQLTRSAFFSLGTNANLSIFALVNNIKLGGVAMYEKDKIRRPEFNAQGQQPTPKDLIKIDRQLNWHSALLSVLVIITFAGLTLVS